ncbi:hypothetical protein [Pseudomonas baetica]|nr:hypothetical protein [Pseudomonas baetica]MDR9864199.1 hypothetical protein [Pseudomonas baetica]
MDQDQERQPSLRSSFEWGGMRRVRVVHIIPVGAAEGCDLLILLFLVVGASLLAKAP